MQTTDTPKPTKVEPVLPLDKGTLWRKVTSGEVMEFARPIAQIVADMSKPIPDCYIEWKPIIKNRKIIDEVPFIGHDTLTLILNYLVPGWGVDFTENQISDRAVVKCLLTIQAKEGVFSRSSLGNDELADVHFGGALCDSEAMAFRRACKHFGLGLALWDGAYVRRLKNERKQTGKSRIGQE